MPAKAGTQASGKVRAFLGSRFRGNDDDVGGYILRSRPIPELACNRDGMNGYSRTTLEVTESVPPAQSGR
jgi:hypothetical protein